MSSSLEEWLSGIGMVEYEQAFKREGFGDMLVVPYLTEQDLKMMGK